MNATTLKALKGSIKKWEGIVAGKVKDEGPDNCPLCKLFYAINCRGCPVSKATRLKWCDGSPYSDLWNGGKATTKPQIAAAKAEVKFLKSLLPKGKRMA
jgi:hypothetical protein